MEEPFFILIMAGQPQATNKIVSPSASLTVIWGIKLATKKHANNCVVHYLNCYTTNKVNYKLKNKSVTCSKNFPANFTSLFMPRSVLNLSNLCTKNFHTCSCRVMTEHSPLEVLSINKVRCCTYLAFRSLNSSHSPRILIQNKNVKGICNTISPQRKIVSTKMLQVKTI